MRRLGKNEKCENSLRALHLQECFLMLSRFRWRRGSRTQMQTRTGVRSKLKGLIIRNQNHSNAGKTRNCSRRKQNFTKLETWNMEKLETRKNRQGVDYGGDGENDGEDLTKSENKTGG